MLLNLILLFTLLPLVELMLLVWIGTKTSLLFTLCLVLTTGLVDWLVAHPETLEMTTSSLWASHEVAADLALLSRADGTILCFVLRPRGREPSVECLHDPAALRFSYNFV